MPDRSEEVRRLREAADGDVRRLRQLLRLKIAEAGWSQRAVSQRMEEARHYVSLLLAGDLDLRFYQALEILLVVGLEPGAFFAELHGGEEAGEQAVVEALSSWLGRGQSGAGAGDQEGGESVAQAVVAAQEGPTLRERSLTGSKRAAELLRAKARGQGRTLSALGSAVGLNASYLGQLLRGADPIKAKQVYAVLRALAIPARVFFAELYPPPSSTDSKVVFLRQGRVLAAEMSELEAWIESIVLRLLRDKGLLPPQA